MSVVITYGTFDHFHEGHRRLLERAKQLGDYLIVGVTSDSFDQLRGKINVEQSLMERIKNVEDSHLADEIIIEEYEGQKIDDIKKFHVDIFAVGSDWTGKFDYLSSYCKVVYLERTIGISSTDIRSIEKPVRIGVIGDHHLCTKFSREAFCVNGICLSSYCDEEGEHPIEGVKRVRNYDDLLQCSDAVYVASSPFNHYAYIKKALEKEKHVLCESPITLSSAEYRDLIDLADQKHLVLMDGIKTAYSIAYCRLLLMVKAGVVGDVVSIDSTSTSLRTFEENRNWPNYCFWCPTDLLPILQIFGTGYVESKIVIKPSRQNSRFDDFTKITLDYRYSTATCKSGSGFKSEGDLVISGNKGYIYVPSPWWKTDYFEIRYENQSENKKIFYPLDGEGIRQEILTFYRSIKEGVCISNIDRNVSQSIVSLLERIYNNRGVYELTERNQHEQNLR